MTHDRLAASDARRRATIAGAWVALGLALAYVARSVVLGIGTSEGDVPPLSVLQLPDGSEVVDEQHVCASGGCWLELEIAPPGDVSPSELATALGLAPSGGRPGTWWDPRSISIHGEPAAEVLGVELSYWR